MQRIPAFDGDRDGPFERTVFELVMAGAVPVEITPDVFRARLPGGRPIGVARFGPDVGARLEAARVGMWRGGGVLVLAGGVSGGRGRVVAASPAFVLGGPVEAVHVDDGGAVDGGGPPLRLGRAPDWEAFWATVAEPARVASPQVAAAAQESSPVVSVAAGAIVAAMFVVQLLRHYDVQPALGRLGSLIPHRVLGGEVWRLGSSMFLHVGAVHIGSNLIALSALGPGTERMLGRWRFALLYALSGIGGGVAATFLSKSPVVGASGAIWGLMTAQLVIVWRVRDRLPPDVWQRMRSGALRNLVLNLVISAMPGIAWSGHLGGGLAGAVVALAYGRPDQARAVRWPLKAAAAAASAFVVLGALYGAFGTDMGFLTRPVVYARADLGWGTAELPVGLSPIGGLLGDLAIDPGFLQVAPGVIESDGWRGFTDEGSVTEGDLAVHRYRQTDLRIAVARKAGDPESPTVVAVWWEKGPWDGSVATHVLRSIERRPVQVR